MSSANAGSKESKLEAYLKTKLPGARDLSISGLESPGDSGFGHTHSFFDLRWTDGGRPKVERLVLREELGGPQVVFETNVDNEFRLQKCLENSGIPVPKMFWLEKDESILGAPFLVMGRVEGRIIVRPAISGQGPEGPLYEASPEGRARIVSQCIEALARIATLDWERCGLSFLGVPSSGTDGVDRFIDYCWRAWRDLEIDDLPEMDAIFDWVRKHRVEPKYVSLCWGDSRFENMMYHDDKIAAVIDWDLAHLGPPEGDLASFLQNVAMHSSRGLPGMPGAEEVVRQYEELTGRTVENLPYYTAVRRLRASILGVRLARFDTKGPATEERYMNMRKSVTNLANSLGL